MNNEVFQPARTVPHHERFPIQLRERLDCMHSSLPWTFSHPTPRTPWLHAQFLTMNVFPSNSANALIACTVPYHERLPIQLRERLDCVHSSLPWTSSHPTPRTPWLRAQFLTMNVFPSNPANALTVCTVPHHECLPIQPRKRLPTPRTPWLCAQFLTMNVFPSNPANALTVCTVPHHERLPIQPRERLDCVHSSSPWTSSHPTPRTPWLCAQFLTMNVFPSNSANALIACTVPHHERLPIQLCERLDCTHSSSPWTSSHPTPRTPWLHAQFLTMNVFPSNPVNALTACSGIM